MRLEMNFLPFVLLGMRTSVGITSGIAPAVQLYGRNLRLPCEFFEEMPEDSTTLEFSDQIKEFSSHLKKQKGIQPRYQPIKPYLDPKLQTTRFVYVRREKKGNLLPAYLGPYLVLEKRPKFFKLLMDKNKEQNISIDRLKACTAHPYNVAPINLDLLYPAEAIVETEEETTEVQPDVDVLEEDPGLLEDLFAEPIDILETDIVTRAGRRIRRPVRFKDYE